MKGIIFNLLEDMVEQEDGPQAWDELLDRADADGGYSAIGDYPSAELGTLVAARARQLDTDEHAVLRDFGHASLLSLAASFPVFFTPHRRTRDFLLTLNDVIHTEVRKLHSHSHPPEFDFTVVGSDHLRMVYHSRRRLCVMAEGMIAGAATHFGETADIMQEECVLTGAERCVLHCTFRGRPDGVPA